MSDEIKADAGGEVPPVLTRPEPQAAKPAPTKGPVIKEAPSVFKPVRGHARDQKLTMDQLQAVMRSQGWELQTIVSTLNFTSVVKQLRTGAPDPQGKLPIEAHLMRGGARAVHHAGLVGFKGWAAGQLVTKAEYEAGLKELSTNSITR